MIAMTMAGFDPSGGAGILNDIKTFHAFGVYGTAILTVIDSTEFKKGRRYPTRFNGFH